MDATMLSRIQFAANISFHVIFPTVSIGLAWFLVYIREMAIAPAAPCGIPRTTFGSRPLH